MMLKEAVSNMDRRPITEFSMDDDDYNKHIFRHIPPPLPLLPQNVKLRRSDWITRLYPPSYEASSIVETIKQIDTPNLDEIIQTSEIAITWVKELHQENKALSLDELIILTIYNFDFGNEAQNEKSPQSILNRALTTRSTMDLLRVRGFFFSLLVALRKLPLVEPLLQSPIQADNPMTLFIPVGPDGNMGGFNVNTLFKGIYQAAAAAAGGAAKEKPLYKCSLCNKEVFSSLDDFPMNASSSLFGYNDRGPLSWDDDSEEEYDDDGSDGQEHVCNVCKKVIRHPTKEDFIIPRKYSTSTSGINKGDEEVSRSIGFGVTDCMCADCFRALYRETQLNQERDDLVGAVFVCPSFVTALSDERSAKDQLRTQKTYFTPNVPQQYAGTLVRVVARREWCYNIQPYSLFPVPGKVLIEPDRVFKVLSVQVETSEVRTVNVEMLDTPLLLEDLVPLARPGLEQKEWPPLRLPGSQSPESAYLRGIGPYTVNADEYYDGTESDIDDDGCDDDDDDDDVEDEEDGEGDEDNVEYDERYIEQNMLRFFKINTSEHVYSFACKTPIIEFPEQPFCKDGITTITYPAEDNRTEDTNTATNTNIKKHNETEGDHEKKLTATAQAPPSSEAINRREEGEHKKPEEKGPDFGNHSTGYGDDFEEDNDLLDTLRSLSENVIPRARMYNVYDPQEKEVQLGKRGLRLMYNKKMGERSQAIAEKDSLHKKEREDIDKIISNTIEKSSSRTVKVVSDCMKELSDKITEIHSHSPTELNTRRLLRDVFCEKNAVKILFDILKVFPLDMELFCNTCKVIQAVPFEDDKSVLYNDGVSLLLTGLEHFCGSEDACATIISAIRNCFFTGIPHFIYCLFKRSFFFQNRCN